MATVTLGNIKFNWKGPYNNSTAYVVDDVVSSGGSSYVCILASTGNAVTNGTYWQQMSAAGTDGTDLTSTLTTQGDIVYRDASGLARLGAGTSGQVLQTGGTGANPSWTTMSSDMVKLADINHSGSTVSTFDIDGHFTSDYDTYKLFINNILLSSSGISMYLRYMYGGSANTSSGYFYAYQGRSSSAHDVPSDGSGADKIQISNDLDSNANNVGSFEFTIYDPLNSTIRSNITWLAHYNCNNATYRFKVGGGAGPAGAMSGIQLVPQSSGITLVKAELYGIKN